jgi:hypothetical protein
VGHSGALRELAERGRACVSPDAVESASAERAAAAAAAVATAVAAVLAAAAVATAGSRNSNTDGGQRVVEWCWGDGAGVSQAGAIVVSNATHLAIVLARTAMLTDRCVVLCCVLQTRSTS